MDFVAEAMRWGYVVAVMAAGFLLAQAFMKEKRK